VLHKLCSAQQQQQQQQQLSKLPLQFLLDAMSQLWVMLHYELGRGVSSVAHTALRAGVSTLQEVELCLELLLPADTCSSSSSSSSQQVCGINSSSSTTANGSSSLAGSSSSSGCGSSDVLFGPAAAMDANMQRDSLHSAIWLQARILDCVRMALRMCDEQQQLAVKLAAERLACERNPLLAKAAVQQLTAVCALLHQHTSSQQAAAAADAPASSSSSSGSSGSSSNSSRSTGATATIQQLTSSIPKYHEKLLQLLPWCATSYIQAFAMSATYARGRSSTTTAAEAVAAAMHAGSTANMVSASCLEGLLIMESWAVAALHHVMASFTAAMSSSSTSTSSRGGCDAALAASRSPALTADALQLVLELQLLLLLLLQQQQQQVQQQQQDTVETVIRHGNHLLLEQLSASSMLQRSYVQSRSAAVLLPNKGCITLLQESGLQLLHALAAPLLADSASAADASCCSDPGMQLVALRTFAAAPCFARGALSLQICLLKFSPEEAVLASQSGCQPAALVCDVVY
jgi:hypothetical protein